MNTEIHTVPPQLPGHALEKMQALKPLLAGVVIAVPTAILSFLLVQTRFTLPYAAWIMMCILGLMVADFLLLILFEPHRKRIGDMTIPALLLFIGVAFSFIMTETLNRFVSSYGFGWLTPLTIIALAAIYGGVLREKFFVLKLVLAVNGLALSLLWCLGDVDKVALPF